MDEIQTQTPVALRALEHYAYCPRQCALIHVEGIWADNEHTVKGRAGHKRADNAAPRTEKGRLVVRGMELWSDQLALHGRADAVEFSADGTIEPVEYKIGVKHGNSAELQVCAQAFCLEEMFDIDILNGSVWYSKTKRRHRFPLTLELRETTRLTIAHIRELSSQRILPTAPNDARCEHCQLKSHCMPDITQNQKALTDYFTKQVLACEF
jgi:CRISPR-associated exonuclease Cas4